MENLEKQRNYGMKSVQRIFSSVSLLMFSLLSGCFNPNNDSLQHASQLRLPGVPPNYQKMLEETDLVVHTGLAEQVITTEEDPFVL